MNLSDVNILWMWPNREADERNIGFGAHPNRFFLGLAASAAFILLFALLVILDAPSRVLLCAGVVSLPVTVLMIAVNRQHYRFYEVDPRARPIRRLDSSTPPPEIIGRRPMTKRKYLASGGPS